jgi:hypothetical protein
MFVAFGHWEIAMNLTQNRFLFRLPGVLSFVSVACMATSAAAEFPLILKNPDTRTVRVTLQTDDSNCYEGSPPLGEVMELPPGGQYRMNLSRVQGHGCNGRQGEFTLQFNPAPPNRSQQHFDFSNDDSLNLTGGRPNVYPGTLSGKNPGDRSYTYTLYKPAAIIAGKAVGSWRNVCQQICNNSTAISKSITKTTERTESEDVTRAVSVSLEAGVEFEGMSASTSVTMSEEKRIGRSMSQSLARGETFSDTRNYVFTPEQMRDFNIFAVWQWVARTTLSDGSTFTVGSNEVTCTRDARPPTYLPGSPEDLKACRGQ